MRAAGELLGVLQELPSDWLSDGAKVDAAEIDRLISERLAARKSKDFATADRIRDELAAKGVVLEDAAGGTTWRVG